jgi:TolB-like protein
MDYLTPAEQGQLDHRRRADPLVEEILRQLDRVLASGQFERVQQKARDFLAFVVAKKLLGQADQIKETTVAVFVFHESADFNPAETSKVRMAAVDLRDRVAKYYSTAGQCDPIQIIIPEATYVPEIRDRRVSVDVAFFDDWPPKRDQRHFCGAISDEIADLLNEAGFVRANRVDALQFGTKQRRYGLRGCLQSQRDVLRLDVSLADLSSGRILCWHLVHGRRDNAFRLTREVADILLKALATVTDGNNIVHVTPRKRSC